MASDELNEREQRFVDEVLRGTKPDSQAAINAGYAESSAHVTASRLLRRDKVRRALEERAKPIREAANVDAEGVLRELLQSVRRYRGREPAAHLRALEMLGRHRAVQAWYDRHRVELGDDVVVTFEFAGGGSDGESGGEDRSREEGSRAAS